VERAVLTSVACWGTVLPARRLSAYPVSTGRCRELSGAFRQPPRCFTGLRG